MSIERYLFLFSGSALGSNNVIAKIKIVGAFLSGNQDNKVHLSSCHDTATTDKIKEPGV